MEYLTRREQVVWRLLGPRLTNREISERLGISIRTAEANVHQVIAKLGVANRRQAGALALARSGVQPPNLAGDGRGDHLAAPR